MASWAAPDPKPVKKSKGAKKTVVCPDCGEAREIWYASTREPKRCMRCHALARRDARTKDMTCPCGKVFKQKAGTSRKHCSDACRRSYGGYRDTAKKQSAQRQGAGNPSFKHGRRVGINVPGWKLERKGEFACRNCGSTKRVELHHAIPRGKCKAVEADLRNGLPLCRECHMGWHYKKVTIYRTVFTTAEWMFLRSVELTGQETQAWLDKNYPGKARVCPDRDCLLPSDHFGPHASLTDECFQPRGDRDGFLPHFDPEDIPFA